MSEGESAQLAAQDAAILNRLKDLLNQQIEQFHRYIAALEKQQIVLESDGTEDIPAYIEIEECAVADIFAIQKVIDPLITMCCTAVHSGDITALNAVLEDLKNRARVQSERNRNLLSTRIEGIRGEIAALRNNPLAIAARRSLYHGAASLVDIEG